MTKRLFTFLILIYLSHATLGQKHFQVAFKLDTSLVLKKVRYQYDDGKRIVFLGDSISKSPNVVIRGKYFGTFATLDIIYNNKDGMLYVSKYLIGDKPAQIDLYYKPNVDQLLLHKRLVNARAVYDVSSNKTYRDLINYNREENLAVYNFTQQYKSELKTNDSLQKVYWGMLRSVNQRTLGFLKQHADDYFSFWYFQHEIATSLGAGNPDTALLREQLSYLQTTFPQKITQSFEGREMIK
jgi:hypothetical protein